MFNDSGHMFLLDIISGQCPILGGKYRVNLRKTVH